MARRGARGAGDMQATPRAINTVVETWGVAGEVGEKRGWVAAKKCCGKRPLSREEDWVDGIGREGGATWCAGSRRHAGDASRHQHGCRDVVRRGRGGRRGGGGRRPKSCGKRPLSREEDRADGIGREGWRDMARGEQDTCRRRFASSTRLTRRGPSRRGRLKEGEVPGEQLLKNAHATTRQLQPGPEPGVQSKPPQGFKFCVEASAAARQGPAGLKTAEISPPGGTPCHASGAQMAAAGCASGAKWPSKGPGTHPWSKHRPKVSSPRRWFR